MPRTTSEEPSESVVANSKRELAEAKRHPFAKMGLFFKQVMGELKKVVTPTRKELFTYTGVVLGFVVVMMVLVTALDFLFGFGVSWVFGNGTELFPAAPAATPAG